MKTFKNGLHLSDNVIHVPGGKAVVNCGGNSISIQEFQARGYDLKTTINATLPSADEIIAMGAKLLGVGDFEIFE